jgi:MtaA/CmuA family methyltransferase
MNGRRRLLALIEGRRPDRLPLMPITMQLAADAIGVPYSRYASDYRLLVEGQLKVAQTYGFDHVSCISDPAREAADCGAAVFFPPDSPPALDERDSLLADKSALLSLKVPDPLGGGRMHDRVKAAALFKEKVGQDKLIEGWVEGPIAQAADLRGINTIMTDFFEDPAFVRDIFEFVVEMELSFAKAQIHAGADIIGIGDAAASLIGPRLYSEFVFDCEKRLVDAIHTMGALVRLHICGDTRPLLEYIGRLACDIVDLDHMVPFAQAREKIGPRQILCGNLDPVSILQDSTPRVILKTLERCHSDAGERYIVAAGCEITRGTPKQNIIALRDYAQSN